MVNKGNHPQMALIQVSELLQFAQIYGMPLFSDKPWCDSRDIPADLHSGSPLCLCHWSSDFRTWSIAALPPSHRVGSDMWIITGTSLKNDKQGSLINPDKLFYR